MNALLKRFIEGNHFQKRTAYKRRAKQERGEAGAVRVAQRTVQRATCLGRAGGD